MSKYKRRNKIDNFAVISGYLMIINGILMIAFFFLSKYLNPVPAFYFSILAYISLEILFIYVIAWCITAVVISHKKIDFRGITILLIVAFLCAGFVFVSFKTSLTDMIKDIPYATSSNYSVTEGICSDAYNAKSQFYFEVNNIYFRMDVSAMKYILKGKEYKVVYLPNSKTVIEANLIGN